MEWNYLCIPRLQRLHHNFTISRNSRSFEQQQNHMQFINFIATYFT